MGSWSPVVCGFIALGIWARPAPAFSEEEASTEKEIQQLSLQQMLQTPLNVWTATKTQERRTQAPAIITTVTREQVEVLGFRSIAELLNNLLGFYVVDTDPLERARPRPRGPAPGPGDHVPGPLRPARAQRPRGNARGVHPVVGHRPAGLREPPRDE
jgi:hypothetical protein